jgi:hypothetical protein
MRLFLWTLALGATAFGQTVETPVSFDGQGRVFRLSPEANRAAGVFPDLADFDHVELWRSDTAVLVQVYHRDGTRSGRTLTPADLDAIRIRTDTYLSLRPVRQVLDQEGRGRFLFEQLPIALGWYGPSVLIIIQPDDLRIASGVYLLSSAASYFIPMAYTAGARVTNAQAHLSVSFGYRGILAGFLLSDLLQVHDETPRWNAMFMLGTSIGGQVAGRILADRFSLGQATLVTNYTDLGTMGGALTGVIVENTLLRDQFNSTPLSALTLAGMAAGIVAGNARAQRWNCTEGQVIVDRTGGLLGAAVAPALYYVATGAQLFHRDGGADLEVLSALAIGGAVAGTWWTETRLHDLPLSISSGYIVAGTTIAGGLVGAGLGFMFNTSNPEERMVVATTAAGGVAGFLGGLRLAQSLEPAASTRAERARFRLELNHAALAGAVAEYAGRRTFKAPNLVTVGF